MADGMQVALSWAATLVVVVTGAWYYGGFDGIMNKYRQTPQVNKSKPTGKPVTLKKTKNKPIGRINGTESSSASERKSKMSSLATGTPKPPASGKEQTRSVENDDDMDRSSDRNFAQELTKMKHGTKYSSSGKENRTKSNIRTVQQKTADEDSPDNMSAATSSTGQDGDDETTPAGSPQFNTTTTSGVLPDPIGVGDMLEPAKEGPSSLRLTNVINTNEKQRPVAKALPEPAETKKQRQQRRRREEEKERIAQSAKEHQAKGQQQMRAARMAEGTSKQTKTDSFTAPTSVWSPANNQNKENAVKQPSSGPATTIPLDTFERKSVEGASNHGAITTKSLTHLTNGQSASATTVNGLKTEFGIQTTNARAASDRERTTEEPNSLVRTQSWADMMDEDEQMKLAEENSVSWEAVTNKKDKKKGRKTDGEMNKSSTKQVRDQTQKSAAGSKTNGILTKQHSASQPGNRFGFLEPEPTSTDLNGEEP